MEGYQKTDGMTLAEILVVVAIIGILWMGMMNFNFEWATDKEHRDRFATKVASIVRHAKTAAVSGRTSITGGCPSFSIEIGEYALTGSSVVISDTGAVASVCDFDPDSSVSAPMFGDSGNTYFIPSITAYDKNGNETYRVADAADYGGNSTGLIAKSVALLVHGSDLSAYPMNGGIADYTKNQAVKLKINAAYKQGLNSRNKDSSRDLWIDLRTGNVEVQNPVP